MKGLFNLFKVSARKKAVQLNTVMGLSQIFTNSVTDYLQLGL